MQDFYSFLLLETKLIKVLIALLYSFFAISISIKIFYKIGFVDKPNSRSSHVSPVSLGGGAVVIPLIIITSVQLGFMWKVEIMASLLILFSISLLDDFKSISPLYRLIFHLISITIFVLIYLLPSVIDFINIGYLINPILLIILILSITWFINAFNFMDGINGITAIEVIFICFSLIFYYYFLEKELNTLTFSVLLSMIAFCYFNWSPAKIFLGDAGSIPLGFIIIYLLIDFSLMGYWIAAILLPLYYIMDTAITLLKRIFDRKIFWQAHKEHFYQKALNKGFSHTKISLYIIAINIGLFLLSFFSLIYKNEIEFLFLGILWCSIFLYYFSKKKNI